MLLEGLFIYNVIFVHRLFTIYHERAHDSVGSAFIVRDSFIFTAALQGLKIKDYKRLDLSLAKYCMHILMTLISTCR